jgi:Fe-S-cluster-containing hydrogenase component 2
LKKNLEELPENEDEKQSNEVSRRDFIANVGAVVAGGVVGGGILSSCSSEPVIETINVTETKTTTMPTTVEIEKTVEVEKIVTQNVEVFKDIANSTGHILHNQDICSGCRTCELVCSLNKEGVINPELSRIQWSKDIFGGQITSVYPCKQCDGPECLMACPTGALHIDSNTRARVIDEEICVGCQLCLNACPLTPHRIKFNVSKNICFKCDLCGGEPKCVKYCPTGALSFVKEVE